MNKVNMSFPKDVLSEINLYVKKSGKTRSRFIRDAALLMIETMKAREIEEKRKKTLERVVKLQDEARKKSGDWDGVEELRKNRYPNG